MSNWDFDYDQGAEREHRYYFEDRAEPLYQAIRKLREENARLKADIEHLKLVVLRREDEIDRLTDV